jgi:hypothetical protein
MFVTKKHLARLVALAAGIAPLLLGSAPAHAQYGGFGLGFGFGFNQVPSPTGLINQQALTAAGRPREGVPSRTPYANNPNSYLNNVRDNGFVPTFDARRRRPPTYQAQPVMATPSNAPQAPQTQRAELLSGNPVVPLLGFFDATQKLIWPSDSPIGGDLKEKRDVSDQASLAVLEETRRQPFASISTAAHARKKLLDYGRPALHELRSTSTPAVSDAFHMFLLSLYDSLEHAASPPRPAPGLAPPP